MKPVGHAAADKQSIEFVPKRELDQAQQEIDRLRKENDRLQQETERLRRELEAALAPASGKLRRIPAAIRKPTRNGRAAKRAAAMVGRHPPHPGARG
jgi:predicted  nucleic acid-binding Zn-ribbon protein